jgi:mannose-6-phosphate isomerase-like protein (cupin superfamily)
MTNQTNSRAVQEYTDVSAQTFVDIRRNGEPVVMRGLAKDWPAVQSAQSSDQAFVDYLSAQSNGQLVRAIMAGHDQQKRFFYNADMSGFNFVQGKGSFTTFLTDLIKLSDAPSPPSMAVQSTAIAEIMPRFPQENQIEFLAGKQPRIWIGNRAKVAPHYDVQENVAVCVAGKRRFTVFPPDQITNLYPGPLDLTPAGTPVSMVDLDNPDLSAFPKYADAMEHRREVELEPGDAIYVPYCWWHGVKSLSGVSCLVNYWWDDTTHGLSGPYDALLHCLGTFRHLPDDQRQVWKQWLNYYVFETSGDPAAHIPDNAKGMLGKPSVELFSKMRGILKGVFAR